MKKQIITVLAALFVVACQENIRISDVPTITVFQTEEALDYDRWFNLSHYVILETTSEALLGPIEKLQITGERIYISDKNYTSLYVYDRAGNFLYKLNKRGQGPDEYLFLTDFEVGDDGIITIYDGMSGNILKYDPEGRLYSASVKYLKGSAVKLLDKGIAVNLGNGSGNEGNVLYNYYYFDDKNNITEQSLPFNPEYLGIKLNYGQGKSIFYEYKGAIYMTSSIDDHVYRVDSKTGKITPWIKFNLHTKRPSEKTASAEARKYLDLLTSGEEPASPYGVYVHGDTVMISYNYKNKPRQVIASIDGKIIESGVLGYDRQGLPFNTVAFLDSDDCDYVVCVIEPAYLQTFLQIAKKNKKDTSVLEKLKLQVSDTDNPILLFYTWHESH